MNEPVQSSNILVKWMPTEWVQPSSELCIKYFEQFCRYSAPVNPLSIFLDCLEFAICIRGPRAPSTSASTGDYYTQLTVLIASPNPTHKHERLDSIMWGNYLNATTWANSYGWPIIRGHFSCWSHEEIILVEIYKSNINLDYFNPIFGA
jgi:hypothetical protein